jgi:hypothetical protein
MQKTPLRGASVPSDFQYFRSISPTYRTYLEQCGIQTVDVGTQYGWIKDFKIFQIVKFERTDLPPTRELLVSVGFKRGIVLWIPAHNDEIKKPWREMMIPGGHFTLTGIGRATAQYWMQWNERARRARKRFLEQDEVEIVEVTKQEFVVAFSTTQVKHAFRSDYIRYFTKMYDINESTVRSFLAISKKH